MPPPPPPPPNSGRLGTTKNVEKKHTYALSRAKASFVAKTTAYVRKTTVHNIIDAIITFFSLLRAPFVHAPFATT